MQSISEILQTIARQRGRGDATPLLAFVALEGTNGERIAHLPIDAELAQAWVALTGEPFRPHQAHALTALRRGEPVALRAANADVALTAYLLLYATLLAEPSATALILAPDDLVVQSAWASIAQLNQDLPRAMQLNALPLGPNRRPDALARAVV
ncbi:MAG TPA: helicase, partial [Kouleothrix sp.]|nr:helicase [Kouleothrix sp.]